MGNILQRHCSLKVGICQLKLYYGWFWLAITLHDDQNQSEVGGLRHANCKLLVVNFNQLDSMGKVYISPIKKHFRVSTATSSVQAILCITHWQFFKLLLGLSVTIEAVASLDVNHSVLSMFDPMVVVTSLCPYAQPSTQWCHGMKRIPKSPLSNQVSPFIYVPPPSNAGLPDPPFNFFVTQNQQYDGISLELFPRLGGITFLI